MGNSNRWLIVTLTVAALVGGVWYAIATDSRARNEAKREPSDSVSPTQGTQSASDSPATLPEPDYLISESGRLEISAESLAEGEMLTLGLALSDDARAADALEVRVISLDGRALDVSALPVAGEGTGVRLAIDADWLQPGSYMIQIKTTENSPLALRRYVLVVQ
jgi:hypothetical protein